MIETNYDSILEKLNHIDPIKYAKNRNFLWGSVTQVSPYVARGVISTKQIRESLLSRGFSDQRCERFFQQLAWRDYFQRTAQVHPDLSRKNIKNDPTHFRGSDISKAILDSDTGIDALDEGIDDLKEHGWVHNHMRMYLAMLHGNVARCHWHTGARWMYYHLLDADMASNDLSWQWVTGANANKLYFANQENINKYCSSKQRGTYLDVEYDAFYRFQCPEMLQETTALNLEPSATWIRQLSSNWAIKNPQELVLKEDEEVLLYTINNLDPKWRTQHTGSRILLLDAKELEERPMGRNTLDFILNLSENLADNVQIVFGSFDDLAATHPDCTWIFKEYPSQQYRGVEDSRDWMYPEVTGYFPSFFGFWKKAMKSIK